MPLFKQLDAGARFIDLRVGENNGLIQLYHGQHMRRIIFNSYPFSFITSLLFAGPDGAVGRCILGTLPLARRAPFRNCYRLGESRHRKHDRHTRTSHL